MIWLRCETACLTGEAGFKGTKSDILAKRWLESATFLPRSINLAKMLGGALELAVSVSGLLIKR
jgi:hypothetical protein